ncbi:hypothetical protein AB1Y20_023057 [Prymnesium parvum]|uniref:Uncharacterized protein n=1 Tax=Prymnesium parvum TaxID=97485 RepID=A0AB34JEC1_PRYPA
MGAQRGGALVRAGRVDEALGARDVLTDLKRSAARAAADDRRARAFGEARGRAAAHDVGARAGRVMERQRDPPWVPRTARAASCSANGGVGSWSRGGNRVGEGMLECGRKWNA